MRVFLERISPLNNAARIKKPLLVVAGQNDPQACRLPSPMQLVWRVRTAGGEVWYLSAQRRGPRLSPAEANRDAYLETAASFLQKLAR